MYFYMVETKLKIECNCGISLKIDSKKPWNDNYEYENLDVSIYYENNAIGNIAISKDLTFFSINLIKDCRGKGYGKIALTSLMNYMFDKYELDKIVNIGLNPSHPDIDDMKFFYKACGFEVFEGFLPLMSCSRSDFYKKFPDFLSKTKDVSNLSRELKLLFSDLEEINNISEMNK